MVDTLFGIVSRTIVHTKVIPYNIVKLLIFLNKSGTYGYINRYLEMFIHLGGE